MITIMTRISSSARRFCWELLLLLLLPATTAKSFWYGNTSSTEHARAQTTIRRRRPWNGYRFFCFPTFSNKNKTNPCCSRTTSEPSFSNSRWIGSPKAIIVAIALALVLALLVARVTKQAGQLFANNSCKLRKTLSPTTKPRIPCHNLPGLLPPLCSNISPNTRMYKQLHKHKVKVKHNTKTTVIPLFRFCSPCITSTSGATSNSVVAAGIPKKRQNCCCRWSRKQCSCRC